MKNLLRNGGFERGNIEFWTGYDMSSFTAEQSPVYEGNYSGMLKANGSNYPYIVNNDYISLEYGEALILEGYLITDHYYNILPEVLYYDENLIQVASQYLISQTVSQLEWRKYQEVITAKPKAEYIKLKFMQNTTGLYYYTCFDNFALRRIDMENVVGTREYLLPLQRIEGPTDQKGEMFASIAFREAVFVLDVTIAAGAAGTLDVTVETYDRGSGTWIDIATFNQVIAATGQQTLVVTAGLGEVIRARAIAGDTNPDYTCRVTAYMKR